jgi:hypothetical protein
MASPSRLRIYRQSISVLFAHAFDLVETEPIIGLCDFGQTDDELVRLLRDFAVLGEDAALGLGDGEDPILALEVEDPDFEAAVEEAGDDPVGGKRADVREGDVDPR